MPNTMVENCRRLGVHGTALVVMAWRMEGKTVDEIAGLMGIHRATVNRHLNAVRARVVQAGESLALAELLAGRERVRAVRDMLHLLCGDVCEEYVVVECEAEHWHPDGWEEHGLPTEAHFEGEAQETVVQQWRRCTTGAPPPPRLTDEQGRAALPPVAAVRAEDVLTRMRGYD